jgi:hypothetical protein
MERKGISDTPHQADGEASRRDTRGRRGELAAGIARRGGTITVPARRR